MIQASRSPSSPRSRARPLRAGPLVITITGEEGPALDLIEATLSLFDVPWDLSPPKDVHVTVEVVDGPVEQPAHGRYLVCAQMMVDGDGDSMRATTARGAAMTGQLDPDTERWTMRLPDRIVNEGWWPEVEDLVSLIVTTGWRRAGWVPLHAAGLVSGSRGVLVCAGSRGGKTTFSLAMARHGWQLLGDDKMLLGAIDGQPVLGAIKHMLNVDPAVAVWLPEVGDLTDLPIYSEWSPKRRVSLGSIWPDAAVYSMTATHLILLVRTESGREVDIAPLSTGETIAALLRQSVIPLDPAVARPITGAIAGLAQGLQGFLVGIPDDIYRDAHALDVVNAALA